MKYVILSFVLALWFLFPLNVWANNNNFVTIVNPVRLSQYNANPLASFEAQYGQISKRKFPATWLVTYDALMNDQLSKAMKNMDAQQELGILLEISPNFASASGVVYNQTDSWHRSSSVFLSGYTQTDRLKLIDTAFKEFKNKFGFIPTSVGGWWVDSYSLEYMKDKYGITANLGCSDQFETDGYHIWGQYWSTPYYPSKYHTAIPAGNIKNKLDIVTLQWAARDPLNGYQGEGNPSLYSTQDYFTKGLDDSYFEKLINLYALPNNNRFGQITVGLEGDFAPESYSNQYSSQLDIINKLRDSQGLIMTNMNQFAKWYRENNSQFSPVSIIESNDLLGKNLKAVWYQSPSYRIGLTINNKTNELRVVDFRVYQQNFKEPYYLSPNKELDLYINIPAVIDGISNSDDIWLIKNNKQILTERRGDALLIDFQNGQAMTLNTISVELLNYTQKIPDSVLKSYLLTKDKVQSKITFYPKDTFLPNDGLEFRALSIAATYFLQRPKIKYGLYGTVAAIFLISVVVIRLKRNKKWKVTVFSLIFIPALIIAVLLGITNSQKYLVSQSELSALYYLKTLPEGNVVVKDSGCLICKWHTLYPHPAFASNKSYINKISHKPNVYNELIFNTKSREEGRNELKKLKAKYIYLVKFENYIETLPFSPGDYNVEKIYENANAQIWKVKDGAI